MWGLFDILSTIKKLHPCNNMILRNKPSCCNHKTVYMFMLISISIIRSHDFLNCFSLTFDYNSVNNSVPADHKTLWLLSFGLVLPHCQVISRAVHVLLS